MTAFYNEFDDAAADWLENLIAAGVIAPGIVDRRSITEIEPDDLDGFTQVHLFAGIGGWSRAARLAGWPDERPLWSASCPCQPFSQAGKGLGTDDPRHLWPHVLRLMRARRPACAVGEQVAAKAGYGWFDGVRADLAGENYACRAVDVPALAVDAPHERNRIYWVAVDDTPSLGQGEGWPQHGVYRGGAAASGADGAGAVADTGCEPWWAGPGQPDNGPFRSDGNGEGVTLGDTFEPRLEGHARHGGGPGGRALADRSTAATDECCDVANANPAWQFQRQRGPEGMQPDSRRRDLHGHGRNGSFWTDADWLICHDGKARRVADASAPLLAHGIRGRIPVSRPRELCSTTHPEEVRWVSRIAAWKGFGNAIVPPLAAEVIAALMEVLDA